MVPCRLDHSHWRKATGRRPVAQLANGIITRGPDKLSNPNRRCREKDDKWAEEFHIFKKTIRRGTQADQ